MATIRMSKTDRKDLERYLAEQASEDAQLKVDELADARRARMAAAAALFAA